MQLLLASLFTTFAMAVFGAPTIQNQPEYQPAYPRIFGNKNDERNLAVGDTNDGDEEEELELESLKGHKLDEIGTSPSLPSPLIPGTSTSTSTSTHASVNTKKPENEEKPAISDNANSLKFPNHNPDGFDESLFVKKSNHNVHSIGQLFSPRISIATNEGGLQRDLPGLGEHGRSNFQQTDYTPQDIAEYIFWTGDERGVAAAIGDYLQDGMVNREDAVRFLEDVKRELITIRSRYATSIVQGQHAQQQQTLPRNLFYSPLEGFKGYSAGGGIGPYSQLPFHSLTAKRDSYPQFSPPEIMNDSPFIRGQPPQLSPGGGPESNSNLLNLSVEELDYDEIAEKLRTVDAKMREYALEDVIYQIGKNLFAESLKNSPGDSTLKFSEFVEAQSASGNIPKDLEKDVLDVLVGAFIDAVDERTVGVQAQQLELEHQLQEHRQNSAHQSKQTKQKLANTSPMKIKKSQKNAA